jgi:hypothetical protein
MKKWNWGRNSEIIFSLQKGEPKEPVFVPRPCEDQGEGAVVIFLNQGAAALPGCEPIQVPYLNEDFRSLDVGLRKECFEVPDCDFGFGAGCFQTKQECIDAPFEMPPPTPAPPSGYPDTPSVSCGPDEKTYEITVDGWPLTKCCPSDKSELKTTYYAADMEFDCENGDLMVADNGIGVCFECSGDESGGGGGAKSSSSSGSSSGDEGSSSSSSEEVSSSSSGEEGSSSSSGEEGSGGDGGAVDGSSSSESSSSSGLDVFEDLPVSVIAVLDSNPELPGFYYGEDVLNGLAVVSDKLVEFRFEALGSGDLPLSANFYLGSVPLATINYPPRYLGSRVCLIYLGVTYCGVIVDGDIVF